MVLLPCHSALDVRMCLFPFLVLKGRKGYKASALSFGWFGTPVEVQALEDGVLVVVLRGCFDFSLEFFCKGGPV